MMVWILALIGTALAATGDWLIFLSIKYDNVYVFWIALFLIGCCGIPWYLILKNQGGWMYGSMIWAIMGTIFSLILSIASNEKQNTMQWIGLVVMLIGIAIRSIK